MSDKLWPNGDHDAAVKAEIFARTLAEDPRRFEIAPSDSDELSQAVQRFRATLQACRQGERTQSATRAKNDARQHARQILLRLAGVVRSNPRIDAATKIALGLRVRERTARATAAPCPQEPPRLRFKRALHEGNGATPMHELDFHAINWSSPRPAGAVRLELFVDLIPPDEPIPAHPGANHGSRPWYLRSYTRSPIVLAPPMARVPMRVLYWGRWADSTGNVGPFSATAVGWIEGGTRWGLPGGMAMRMGLDAKQTPLLELATTTGPADRQPTIRIAVLEAQYESYNPQLVAPPATPAPAALPAPDESAEEAA